MDTPPLWQLEQDPEEWARLHRQIRAEQRARRGRWDYAIHPFEVIYAAAFLLLRAIVGNAFGIVWALIWLAFRIVTFPVRLLLGGLRG